MKAQNQNEKKFSRTNSEYSKDTATINSLYLRAERAAFQLDQIRKAKQITDSAYELSKKINYRNGIAKHWNLYGKYAEIHTKFPEASRYQNIALSYCEPNSMLEARILNDMGTIFRRTDNYTGALIYLHKALVIAKRFDNSKAKMYALNGIGNCNVALSNLKSALENYTEALSIAQKYNHKQSIAINLNNIGEIFEINKEYDKALEYYNNSLKVNDEIQDSKGISISNSCIGNIYYKKGDYLKALSYFSRSLADDERVFEKFYITRNNINVAKCYIQLGKYQKAETFLQTGLETAQTIKSKTFIRDAYQVFSELYAKQKQFEKAYQYMQIYAEAKDSVINEKITSNYAKLLVQFELEQNNAKLIIMEQNTYNQHALLIKNRIIITSISLSLFIAIIALFTYLQNRARKKSNQELAEKNAEILNVNDQLLAEVEHRMETEDVLRELLHEKEILISEVHHRVKNNLALITGLMYLQVQKVGDTQSKAILNETMSRIHSIALIHENIYLSEKHAHVNFGMYLTKQIEEIKKYFNNKTVEVELNVPEYFLELHQAVPLGLIANELISNAFLHAFIGRETGKVSVSFLGDDNNCTLEIEDNGIGLPENFDYEKVEAPGFIIISIFVKQLAGTLRTRSLAGAFFSLNFTPTKMKVWK